MPRGFIMHTGWRTDGPRLAPRSVTHRRSAVINTVYLHWPGAPGSLLGINTREEERRWMRDIYRFHVGSRGWSDFAYNHAIFPSGHIHRGRGLNAVPAAQAPFNTTGLAIVCVLGAGDRPTRAMRENLADYVRWAERSTGHDLRVRGHRDVNRTTCPGDALMRLVPDLSRL
jgi:N-acetylmuramoyl-L-alanine amidase